MKTILVIGAGMSSSSLIRYLLENSTIYNWKVRVVDQDIKLAERKINGHPNGIALSFNALESVERRPEIEQASLVISMLPARFHVDVAKDCIDLKTNLITPSYISPEMRALDEAAKKAGIVIMNEIGVDPGIDHMSAMKIIDHISAIGGKVHSFKSFCGGLIAPESDNNPWNYKFTWNPRNVVLAGQGSAACFIEENQYKYIPYSKLFSRIDLMAIPGYGEFEGYANRDSLSYRGIYGLENIPTIFRGTLRRPNYCKAWDAFVQLGLTDDSYKMAHSEELSPRTFINSFLPFKENISIEEKFKKAIGYDEDIYHKFEWLGFFDASKVMGLKNVSPAQLLENILVSKWTLDPSDKDMLVMFHEFVYELNGEKKKLNSYMVNIGEDSVYTSMSNTVGLPAAICAKMILNETLEITGVQMPISAEVYNPILKELEENGITFLEEEFDHQFIG
ncbi:MAG: saccharopine dehydrogenase NADP-binding domain-containing protein [Flavobacteriia bacterium]|nr:saccharopine dehydrogenase NADP-binding domain-containing protein [Flavobacteriia bacterium]